MGWCADCMAKKARLEQENAHLKRHRNRLLKALKRAQGELTVPADAGPEWASRRRAVRQEVDAAIAEAKGRTDG